MNSEPVMGANCTDDLPTQPGINPKAFELVVRDTDTKRIVPVSQYQLPSGKREPGVLSQLPPRLPLRLETGSCLAQIMHAGK
jgi:hypothetical protein